MDNSFNPEEEQRQERLVLQSILMDEFLELPPEMLSLHRCRRRLALTILPHPSGQEPNHVQVVLGVTLEPTYPILIPTVVASNSPAASHKLSESTLAELVNSLAQLSKEHAGSVHLMALADLAREFLCARNVPEPRPISAHEQMTRRQKEEAPAAPAPAFPAPLQPSPNLSGRMASLDMDVFKLEDVEAALEVQLQATHRRRKQMSKRRGKPRGGGDGRDVDGEGSDEEDPPNKTRPRPSPKMGPKMRPTRADAPKPAPTLPAATLVQPPLPKPPLPKAPLLPPSASTLAEAAVGAGRKVWGSVKDLLSTASWSREAGRGAADESSTGGDDSSSRGVHVANRFDPLSDGREDGRSSSRFLQVREAAELAPP